ncbi:bifunctional metallophosphatase/5'-nucleotidase [Sphingomonas piscis]|uniref:Bifunctional metallophosphatase/5'-nucleotidase n=1 Tax=Sphingomonas piscis TaxID=2714943 RepID=A0A6G7YLS3_9SPHN|nr:bifunctional metallophosphatase/5'-nucleotidase [Sphingomonas piscis]QIK77688.1 bifunctional metallophosphatase/5'-nucleotidase [Sphingomonas piscis]
MMRPAVLIAALWLAGCASLPVRTPNFERVAAPIEVQILALNDFHGNLEPPSPVELATPDGGKTKVRSGGAVNVAAALGALRAGHANSITVSAGDTIGASPLISGYFLDEPTIEAFNRMGVEFNSVGNHEFDKGVAELKRMQSGGCDKHTARTPCAVEPFRGASFQYLAANVLGTDGKTVLPATGLKTFGSGARAIRIGFIGMTLQNTSNLVTPSGVRGLTFADEAETANALVPQLKAQGADTIVLLIHQGGKLPQFTAGNGCDGLYGEILPILPKLDPAITTVVSGHTHWAYVCQQGSPVAPRLLTSAGKNGYFVTDLRLRFDPVTHRLLSQDASNVIVGDGGAGKAPEVQSLVQRYAEAIKPVAEHVVGRLTAPAPRDENDAESPAADLIADSMLAATRQAENGGAQLALVNATGVRIGMPGGDITYANAFQMMPFGNNLVVMTLTGAQLKKVLEQQYSAENLAASKRVPALAPSDGFTYAIDVKRPNMARVFDIRLNGEPVNPARTYRVVVNNYVASGGDGLTGFTEGSDLVDKGIVDLDAFVAWIAPGRAPPLANRIRNATPR